MGGDIREEHADVYAAVLSHNRANRPESHASARRVGTATDPYLYHD